jgi:molybdopterin converting factor small subunit
MAKLLFFGPLSDVLEVESMTVPLPGEIKTIRDLVSALHQRGARWQRYLNTDKLQITINRQFGDANTEITNSDEIAFISRPGSI